MIDFLADDTAELQQWRMEVRDFLVEHWPADDAFDFDYDENPEGWRRCRTFWHAVGRKKWVGLTWPEEYYGLGRPAIYKWILDEEFVAYGAPTYPALAGNFVDPIIRLGTPAQRLKYLKGIADVTELWAEGYSEPSAGSDLAALTAHAKFDGTDWILNGQKTLGTAAHECQWMCVLARTSQRAKRHEGISCFLVDLRSPGVLMTPLENIAGGQQNATYFDNVKLPSDALLGEEGMAWRQVWFGMGGEPLDKALPTAAPWQFRIVRMLKDVVTLCRETNEGDSTLAEDPVIEQQLADLIVAVDVMKLQAYEMYSNASSGIWAEGLTHLHSAFHKELWPRLAQTIMDILGPRALLLSDEMSLLRGRVGQYFLASFGNHAGGTAQLKRMLLATRGLGLPR